METSTEKRQKLFNDAIANIDKLLVLKKQETVLLDKMRRGLEQQRDAEKKELKP